MVFKRMLSALGVGGPSVDTVLANPNTRPGLMLEGRVDLRGGEVPAEIEHISLALVTRVEMESGDAEFSGAMEFHRMPVAGGLRLSAGQELSIPFQLPVPWETPITEVYGQRAHGVVMGLRTEVAVARAVDQSDLDQIAVHPLPVHERILDAFARLGFRFRNVDLEHGRIHGVRQTLPFYQEIEFRAAPQFAHAVNEVELTFVTNQYTVDVIIECDKRAGLFTPGHDSFGRYVVDHATVEQVDWIERVDGWLRETVAGHGARTARFSGHSGGHHGHGSGLAGAALGFAGGLVAGEILDDVFDSGEGGFFEE